MTRRFPDSVYDRKPGDEQMTFLGVPLVDLTGEDLLAAALAGYRTYRDRSRQWREDFYFMAEVAQRRGT